jgi:hypothetical protein
MVEQYIAKMKELMELGQQILDDYDEYEEDFVDEVECMNFHLEVGYKIITEEDEEDEDDE